MSDEYKPIGIGSRVVVLDGPYRGAIGFVRGWRWARRKARQRATREYLICNNAADAKILWWVEVRTEDLTVVDPPAGIR